MPESTPKRTELRATFPLMGLAVLASIVFAVLKLAGVLNLTWVAVLLPILVVLGLWVMILVLFLALLTVGLLVAYIGSRR